MQVCHINPLSTQSSTCKHIVIISTIYFILKLNIHMLNHHSQIIFIIFQSKSIHHFSNILTYTRIKAWGIIEKKIQIYLFFLIINVYILIVRRIKYTRPTGRKRGTVTVPRFQSAGARHLAIYFPSRHCLTLFLTVCHCCWHCFNLFRGRFRTLNLRDRCLNSVEQSKQCRRQCYTS